MGGTFQPACPSMSPSGRAVCLLLCVCLSLQLTISLCLPLYLSSPSQSHCFSLSISLISFCLSLFSACLSLPMCLSCLHPSLFLCLCFSLYVSCAYLTVCPSSSFSVLLTPQPLQQDPERSGPPSLTRQTLLIVPGRADPGKAALHLSALV